MKKQICEILIQNFLPSLQQNWIVYDFSKILVKSLFGNTNLDLFSWSDICLKFPPLWWHLFSQYTQLNMYWSLMIFFSHYMWFWMKSCYVFVYSLSACLIYFVYLVQWPNSIQFSFFQALTLLAILYALKRFWLLKKNSCTCTVLKESVGNLWWRKFAHMVVTFTIIHKGYETKLALFK